MKYKLLDDAFSKSDIAKGVKVLKSKQRLIIPQNY